MVIDFTGFGAYNMGDANRFLAPWVERYGQNLQAGNVLQRSEILAVLRDWNYCDVHKADNTDRDAVIACPNCQRRVMDLGQFTSSIKMPLSNLCKYLSKAFSGKCFYSSK